MSDNTLSSILANDSRFVNRGYDLRKTCISLSEIFNDSKVIEKLSASFSNLKNAVYFINILQYANKQHDSIVTDEYTVDLILDIIENGIEKLNYTAILDKDLKSYLLDDYLDYKIIDVNEENIQYRKENFIKELTSSSNISISSSEINQNSYFEKEEYLTQSVRLDFPYIPQPDISNKYIEFSADSKEYCVYKDSIVPWNQSQITSMTDINLFSNSDILRLFPLKRIYTRSPYMYMQYNNLDYDKDLGTILKIKGFTKKQIIKNIIEYPHLEFLERNVKIKGKDATIPFWKYIEIDGEIFQTTSIWQDLPDTKNIPKTESFMNEYVVRRYLLERDKNVEHKYEMRGTIEPFLTLYNSYQYYENLGYDPIEIGKQCIKSRISFKYSRNPILNNMARDN